MDVCLCAGVLRPQPPEGHRLHPVDPERRPGAGRREDAQTGRERFIFTDLLQVYFHTKHIKTLCFGITKASQQK